MAIIVVIEIVWLLIYLTQKLPFALYIVLAIVILAVGLCIWDLWLKKEHTKKKAEQQIILTYGYHLTDAEICERKKDPRYRNQERGRGSRNCNLDPEHCEICGSPVPVANLAFFWQSKHLCPACEQRYREAQEKGMITHIAGYTDDKEHGESNQRELWVKQQIAALDLRDGVIDEATARAEIKAAEEAGKQWTAEQKTMKERERRRQIATQRDEEEKSHLNEDVQRLLN